MPQISGDGDGCDVESDGLNFFVFIMMDFGLAAKNPKIPPLKMPMAKITKSLMIISNMNKIFKLNFNSNKHVFEKEKLKNYCRRSTLKV